MTAGANRGHQGAGLGQGGQDATGTKGAPVTAIKVTSEQLQSVSSSLSSGSDEVASRLATMESQVRALVDADWSGAASDSFRDLYEQWHRSAESLKQALDGIAQMLGQAGRTYQDTEDALASQLRG